MTAPNWTYYWAVIPERMLNEANTFVRDAGALWAQQHNEDPSKQWSGFARAEPVASIPGYSFILVQSPDEFGNIYMPSPGGKGAPLSEVSKVSWENGLSDTDPEVLGKLLKLSAQRNTRNEDGSIKKIHTSEEQYSSSVQENKKKGAESLAVALVVLTVIASAIIIPKVLMRK